MNAIEQYFIFSRCRCQSSSTLGGMKHGAAERGEGQVGLEFLTPSPRGRKKAALYRNPKFVETNIVDSYSFVLLDLKVALQLQKPRQLVSFISLLITCLKSCFS